MPVTATELRNAADAGKEAGADDLARRTAVNRSYYAAFHSLESKLRCMASSDQIGSMGCMRHGAVPFALRKFQVSYPDSRTRMAKGAEAARLVNYFETVMLSRQSADYDISSSGDFDPRELVLHLGRIDRLLKFAAALP